MTFPIRLVCLTAALGSMCAVPALAQSISVEMGRLNFGPVVTEETVNHVRFGSTDGMATYYALSVSDSWWYGTLRFAPTEVYVWPRRDSRTASGVGSDRGSDPTRSRWRYSVQGSAQDSFVWGELVGGVQVWRGPFEGRVGLGAVQLAQTDHGWWGTKTGSVPMAEAGAGLRLWMVGLQCRGSAIRLGRPFGRWPVLEQQARNVDDGGSTHWIRPIACGAMVTLGDL